MTNSSSVIPSDATSVWVYKGSRRLETYLYLGQENGFDAVPPDLIKAMGRLELVMQLELTPDRKLARANARTVLAAIERAGFYLQMPPLDNPADSHVH